MLFCFFVLTLSNCQVEEDAIKKQSNIQTVSLNEATSFLKGNPVNKYSRSTKKTVLLPDFEKITQERIINSDQLLTVIPLITNNKEENSRILLLRIEKELKSVIFSMYPEKSSTIQSFTGKILIHALNGDFINGYRLEKGNIVAQFFQNKNASKNSSTNVTNKESGECDGCIELNEVIIIKNRSNSSYYLELAFFKWDDPISGGNSNEDVYWWDYIDGGSATGHVIPLDDELIAQAIEDNIDYTKLDACPKGIMDELKNSTNNDIKSILEKFGAGTVYTVKMKMGVMQYPQDFAETQPISKNNYLITVTQDSYTSATKLYKATALLHETIHAYMLSVVDDYNTYPTNAPFNDFPDLFKLYVEKTYSSGAVVAQHEDMANRYVDVIASSLEQYQENTGFPNFISDQPDKQAFLDMTWSGLQGTDIFNKKYPVGSAERKRLDNRFSAEQIGANYGGQNVIGKPCN